MAPWILIAFFPRERGDSGHRGWNGGVEFVPYSEQKTGCREGKCRGVDRGVLDAILLQKEIVQWSAMCETGCL